MTECKQCDRSNGQALSLTGYSRLIAAREVLKSPDGALPMSHTEARAVILYLTGSLPKDE